MTLGEFRQLTLVAREILAELRESNKRRDSLLGHLDAIQQQLQSAAEQQHSKNASDQAEPEKIAPSEFRLPPAIVEYYNSEQHECARKNRWGRCKRFIEVGALIAVGAAAVFTYRQWRMMDRTFTEIQSQTSAIQQTANANRAAAEGNANRNT